MHFVEGRDTVIPFKKRGGVADAFDGAGVKLPDRIDDGVVVGIQNIFAVFRMAGDVNLGDALGRHAVHVSERIEAVVLRRNVDIVDVKKNAAVGAFDDFI